MPLYPTSFFIPPTGVPFILEDKYFRGGYRVSATLAERDAIHVAARKQGMLVRVTEDNTIYELVGGTTNTHWAPFNVTRYLKLGNTFDIDAEGNLTIKDGVIGEGGGGEGGGGTLLARATLNSEQGLVASGASKDFVLPTGKTAMVIALSVNNANVTVECHSTASRTDVNPYKFKSATGKLFDDGTSVLEDESVQYNRRYAFIANLEDVPSANTYWRVTNNAASSQSITVNITYLTFE